MNKNLTEIVFILDRSGSMSGLESDTIGGFNAMIEKQKKAPGEALVSTLGVTGGNKKSGLYEDGVRKDRLDNNDMIDQLEARIRAKASMLDEARRIDVQQVEAK